MTRALLPTLLATLVATQAGCYTCYFPVDPAPHGSGERGLKSGPWAFDIQASRVEGDRDCRELFGAAEDTELRGFIRREDDGALLMDLDGVKLRGQQEGRDVFAVGELIISVDYAAGTEEEEPRTEEDSDSDDCGDESDGGEPPPCAPPSEGEEERPPHGDSEDEPRDLSEGILIELSALADDATWMRGDILLDYVVDGRVRCSARAPFDAWHLDEVAP